MHSTCEVHAQHMPRNISQYKTSTLPQSTQSTGHDQVKGHMTHHFLSPSDFVLGLPPPPLHMLSLIATGILEKALGGSEGDRGVRH